MVNYHEGDENTILVLNHNIKRNHTILESDFTQDKRNLTIIESHFTRDNERSAAHVNKIECPATYLLSKNNKLCYFLARTRLKGSYLIDALLVNKTEAVEICKFHMNGVLLYGELKESFRFLNILLSLRSESIENTSIGKHTIG